MRGRRGFTLVEMLVTLVMMVLVGAVLTRLLVNSMRVSQSQLVTADLQSNVRTGSLVLPLELREVGYDSSIVTNAVISDLEAIAQNSVDFRAGRGFGTTCAISADLTEWRIRKPVHGLREPLLTDGFSVYVENDENLGTDDQWVNLPVTAIDLNGTCGLDPAIIITTNTPDYWGVPLTPAQVFVGGAIRWYERMRYGLFVDADGRSYLGARSLSVPDPGYRAVAGPVADVDGVRFRYYNRPGNLLDPTVAPPISVRTMEIVIAGRSRNPVTLAGSANRATRGMTTVTRVALRNTLRH